MKHCTIMYQMLQVQALMSCTRFLATSLCTFVIFWLSGRSSTNSDRRLSESCEDLCQQVSNDPNMLRIITSDKSWVHGYNSESKPHFLQWRSLHWQSKEQPKACWCFSLTFAGLCALHSCPDVCRALLWLFWAMFGRTFQTVATEFSDM